MTNYDIIVIGSGPGGYVAAIRASQLNMKAAVVERAELGGICLNWGCIPTKALLKSAQVFKYMTHAADYGISLEGQAAPDFKAVVARSRGVAENMSKGVQYLLKKNNVDMIAGEGRLAGGHIVEVKMNDGSVQTFEAKHIVLATGARSRSLPNVPQDGKHVIGYREALTLPELPKSMVVMGSGAIGSELAYFYSTMGTEVTIVEYMPRLVPVEDDDIAAQLARSFRKQGIKTMTGASVEKVDIVDDRCVVTVKDSKEKVSEITCDVVLSAVGVTTNIEGLGLEECGVSVERGKVVVDDFYRTSVDGVYAIGDIVHGPALAHVASHEALVCVEKIAGHNPAPVDYGNIPGCTYTTPEIASVGLTERACKEQGLDVLVGKFPFTASGKAAASGNRDGLAKVIFDKATGKWLGCHLCGDNVTEMIAGAVAARKAGMTGPEVVSTVFPHPTMSEAIMEAAAAAYNECVHI
ncbi:MAG: dihydrolipoyl dehydrogenase [Bacteroidales bacterium]|nr:dihydrolipoyl dehydrogenase [Bacteroidales bacterium]